MNYGMRKYPNYPEQHCHSFRKHGGCSALGQAARKPADPERGNPTRTVSHVAMETVVREAERQKRSQRLCRGSSGSALLTPDLCSMSIEISISSPAIYVPTPKETACGQHFKFFISKTKPIIISPKLFGTTSFSILVNGANSTKL